MSFVGHCLALSNQEDLIALRAGSRFNEFKPGSIGWSQVNGLDKLTITEKVDLDVEYLNHQPFWFNLKILWMTLLEIIRRYNVSH